MGGLFGGTDLNSNSFPTPSYTGINIQTSTTGISIPIVFGAQRVSGNLLSYSNFSSQASDEGGKGGSSGKNGSGSTTYFANIIQGICEGDDSGISGITQIYASGKGYPFTSGTWTLFTGTATQTPWSGSPSGQALSYARTCYVASANHSLGSDASLPALNWEVHGFFWNSLGANGNGNDCLLGDCYYQLLTNKNYGVGLDSSYVDMTGLAYWKNYNQAQGLWFSPYLHDQEQMTDTTDRWAQISNTWIFWSGSLLKFVPLGDQAITANGVTYTPNITPIYALVSDDFQRKAASDPPVKVNRKDIMDCYNQVQLDIVDRANSYNSYSVKYQDQNSVELYGLLQSQTVEAGEIADLTVGQIAAALIGKRAVNIRNEYVFFLSSNFILLEPGDIVTLTEPIIGLVNVPVRIKEVQEDDENTIQVTCEEFPAGIGVPPVYGVSSNGSGPLPDPQVSPGSVNTPGIFEPGAGLTGGTPAVFIGLSGGPNFGSANVNISFDGGTNYAPIGQSLTPSIQGTLTAALALATGLDTTNTLAIDTTECNVAMPILASHADAAAFRTLCLVDDEIIAYGSVVVGSGPFLANITYLERGVYGTTPAAHAIGATFTRIQQPTIFKYSLPSQYVGATLFFKFQAINIFGNQLQDISTCTAYSYTPTGLGYYIAPPTSVGLSASSTTQADGTTILQMTGTWTTSAGPLLGSNNVEWSLDGGTTWTGSTSVAGGATQFIIQPAVASTNYQFRVQAVSSNGQATSSWANSSVVNSGTLVTAVPASPSGVVSVADANSTITSWNSSSDLTIRTYQIWRATGLSQPFSGASQVGTVGVGSTSYLDTSTAASTGYTYFVVAVNPKGSSVASLGANVTTGVVGAATPADLPASFIGSPTASMVLYRLYAGHPFTLPSGLSGSTLACSVAPTSNWTVTINKNGSSIGTGTIAASATTGTFTFSSNVTFASGDLLEVDCPASVDATLANPSITLAGTR